MTNFVDAEAARIELLRRMTMGESLSAICADPEMPNRTTVKRWRDADPQGFGAELALAVEVAADVVVDELGDIAKAAMKRENVDLVPGLKLATHIGMWKAAVMAPERYGSKTRTEVSGPNGGAIPITDPARPQLSKEEWLALHGIGPKLGSAA